MYHNNATSSLSSYSLYMELLKGHQRICKRTFVCFFFLKQSGGKHKPSSTFRSALGAG